MSTTVDMRRLLQAGVHFGHQTRYWSPSMAPYIFGRRNKIHIINLEKTLPMLDEATNYLGSLVAQGGKVLFVGTKRQAGKQVREAAIDCNSPYVDHRWLGGMLTNFNTVKNSIARLKELEVFMGGTEIAKLSKKEVLSLDRERMKLDRTLSGIKNLDGLPDALFVIDIQYEKIAVKEAAKLRIPVVAIVDTNCTPNNVDYVIPGNDDSAKAIGLYLEAVSTAIKEAHDTRKQVAPLSTDDQFVDVEEVGKVVDLSSVLESGDQEDDANDQNTTQSLENQTQDTPRQQVVKRKVVRRKVANTDGTSDQESDAEITIKKTVSPSLDKVEEILAEVEAGTRSQAGAIRYMHEAGMDHQDISGKLNVNYEQVREILLESSSMLTRPVDPEPASIETKDPFA